MAYLRNAFTPPDTSRDCGERVITKIRRRPPARPCSDVCVALAGTPPVWAMGHGAAVPLYRCPAVGVTGA